MFEHRSRPLISRKAFFKRQLRFFFYTMVLILFSLGLGCLGYHYFASLSWIDSLLNASMILTGMGPVSEMSTYSAKLFASLYALYSGIAFLSTAAVFLAPSIHRIIHIIHLDDHSNKNIID